jgi:DNA-binding LacI/PurR family transcriptional regulator
VTLAGGLYEAGELTLQEIAGQFGVSRMTVYRVVKEPPERTAQRAQQAAARAKARAAVKAAQQ